MSGIVRTREATEELGDEPVVVLVAPQLAIFKPHRPVPSASTRLTAILPLKSDHYASTQGRTFSLELLHREEKLRLSH
jgi:hypothetical protein